MGKRDPNCDRGGHSRELIELNDSVSLGSLDEAGMEGCHKLL